MEGFRTLGIAVGDNRRRFYKAFPGAEPDEWLMLEEYREMLDYAEYLRKNNVIIVPHDLWLNTLDLLTSGSSKSQHSAIEEFCTGKVHGKGKDSG